MRMSVADMCSIRMCEQKHEHRHHLLVVRQHQLVAGILQIVHV